MPVTTALPSWPRTPHLLAATALLAVSVADNVRVRRQRDAAGRDELTGLPRRPALEAYGKKLLARRFPQDTLVLVLDGDGFKTINDTFGHAAGDQVVRTLGQRLHHWCTTHHGRAARLGGDEFAAVVRIPRGLLVPELTALRAALNQPVRHGDASLSLSVSIGAAYATDLREPRWGTVLRAADVSMYRVKRRERPFPYLGTARDAAVPAINGRRPGRPGTHLAVATTAAAA